MEGHTGHGVTVKYYAELGDLSWAGEEESGLGLGRVSGQENLPQGEVRQQGTGLPLSTRGCQGQESLTKLFHMDGRQAGLRRGLGTELVAFLRDK